MLNSTNLNPPLFTLPKLPYAVDALEPFIDAQTMQLHHDKHHQTYLDKFNEAISGYPELQSYSAEEILTHLSSVIPGDIRTKVTNFGGGFVNHSFFWQILSAKHEQKPSPAMSKLLDQNFGGYDQFVAQFTQAAAGLFGSGWVWLVANSAQKLQIMSLPNQDSPLSQGFKPLLALDVWEHAYYLKYQNRRPEYVQAFWSIVNWERVSDLAAEL